MKLSTTFLASASMATLSNAHGYFESPQARQPGPAFQKSCGMQAYYNLQGDINNNIQGLAQVASSQTDYDAATCNLWLCKGLKYDDGGDGGKGNVQKYSPGQTVPMNFHIQAPHDGYANVSIVNTHTNTILRADLKKWDEYALTSTPMKESWQEFEVKMPQDLGSECEQAGDCVIQMHWDAPSVDQTYQSCVDFTLGGGSGKREVVGRVHPRDFFF